MHRRCYITGKDKEKNIENINQIETNLLIPSVDLNDGKIYFFTSFEKRQRYSDQIIYVNDINIGKAVRASCTYPGVFSPCEYNDTYLVDGGIRENVPWKGLKENGADKVFCVTFEEELKEKLFLFLFLSNSQLRAIHMLKVHDIELTKNQI